MDGPMVSTQARARIGCASIPIGSSMGWFYYVGVDSSLSSLGVSIWSLCLLLAHVRQARTRYNTIHTLIYIHVIYNVALVYRLVPPWSARVRRLTDVCMSSCVSCLIMWGRHGPGPAVRAVRPAGVVHLPAGKRRLAESMWAYEAEHQPPACLSCVIAYSADTDTSGVDSQHLIGSDELVVLLGASLPACLL